MGKRENGQIDLFDFVVILLISDLSSTFIDENDNMFYAIIPPVVLIIIQKMISFIALKSNKFRKLISGDDVLIIYKRMLNIKRMRKEHLNIDDIIGILKVNQIKSISQVEYLFINGKGETSIFLYKDYDDTNISLFPVIMSGEIVYNNLIYNNITKEELLHLLNKDELNIKDIVYANIENDKLFIPKIFDEKSISNN